MWCCDVRNAVCRRLMWLWQHLTVSNIRTHTRTSLHNLKGEGKDKSLINSRVCFFYDSYVYNDSLSTGHLDHSSTDGFSALPSDTI